MSGESIAMRVSPVTLELSAGTVRLEPLSPNHAPSFFKASRDPVIWRYLPNRQPATLDEVSALIDSALEAQRAGLEIPFAIVDRGSGGVVGSTRYLDIQPAHRSLEIGSTWLSPAAQRTAINTQCKYLLLRHAFEALGAVRVCLKTDGRNQQSQRAILRIGALYEGRLRRSRVLHDGFIRDTMYYSILDSEWPGVKARLETMLAR